jgi:hypothetical protein
MRTVGTKTVATLALLGGAVAAATATGVLDPRRLAGAGAGALFGAGAFAALVGTIAHRLFGLGEPSGQAVRLSSGPALWEAEPIILQAGEDGRARRGVRVTLAEPDETIDLGPRAQHAICVAVALLLALACADARTVRQLAAFVAPSEGGSQVCPALDPAVPAQVRAAARIDPDAIGCALVQRAFQLGYASSLGDCAPKETPIVKPPCTLRQYDEPPLHYAWRLFASFEAAARRAVGEGDFGGLHAFARRADHLPALAQAEEQVLRSAPRADRPPGAHTRRAALAEAGALDDVQAVLRRHRIAAELAALDGEKPPADPSTFLGFYCYAVGAPAARRHLPFTLDGQPLEAAELVEPAAPADEAEALRTYDRLARLYARGFQYGALRSDSGIERAAPSGVQALLQSDDFALTRLYALGLIDLYLDEAGVARRPDLLEVYPYERHLANFVETFRRQYRREKGRL